MKKRFASSCVVSVALFAIAAMLSCGPAVALPAADVYPKIAPSVWRVQTYDEDGLPIALGSAVVVAPEVLATNCHVLARASRVSVKHEKRSVAAKLLMWDPARDVCELRAVGLDAPAVAFGDAASLRVGQSVYTLGNPIGLDLTLSEGLLSSIRRNDQDRIRLLQISAPMSLGSSGGGLFDDQARLIGLTTLVAGAALPNQVQGLNFAVPVEWVTELPQRFAKLTAPAAAASAASPPESGDVGVPAFNPPAAGAVEDATKLGAGHSTPALADDAHLPHSTEKMREGYRDFLTHSLPRAFVVGENGSWWATWRGIDPPPPGVVVDVVQRAMLHCQRRTPTRCHLYAVGDQVVYDASAR